MFARYAAHVRANSFDFKGEIAIFSIDTPFALTEFFRFEASLLPSLRQITKPQRFERSIEDERETRRSFEPVFFLFVKLKHVFACKRNAITRRKNAARSILNGDW